MRDDDPIVAFIAAQPGAARRLLARHVDDGSGHCRVCRGPAQAGYLQWPCTIHDHARRALRPT